MNKAIFMCDAPKLFRFKGLPVHLLSGHTKAILKTLYFMLYFTAF